MSSRLLTSTIRRSAAGLIKPVVARSVPTIVVRQFVAPTVRLYSTPAIGNLKKVIESEIQEITDISNQLDEESQAYIQQSGFKVQQKDGSVVVQLTKKTSDSEVVHVFFDADDVTNIPNEMSEGSSAEEGAAGFEDELDAIDELMCNARVVVENTSNNTALFVNLFLENEAGLVVDHFNVQENATEFLKEASEGKFSDLVSYSGPSFSMLDENLQITFEEYLESKGINHELSDFITSYSEFKEENEYRKWLTNVKSFF